jgi:putative ABC transport system substrate-binding protein
VLWPAFAQAAEPAQRPLVIAVLLYSKNNIPSLAGIKAGLLELGYVEGKGVEYIFDGVVESIEGLDPAMTRLMARKPDLVYAAPTPAAQVALKACRERKIPVLFGPVNDAVAVGLVKDRKHPGENITGVMLSDSEGKRLQWSLEIAPGIKNVLVPYNPEDKSSLLSLEAVREAAASLGLELLARTVRNHAEIDALITQWPEGVDSVFLPRDGMVMSRIKDFVDLAIRKKMVLTSSRIEQVEQGALFSYGFDGFELGWQVARLADQIFKGKNPGDLPVETAEDYLAINLKTAKAIGLTVDKRILGLAHRVIRPE